MFYDNPVESNQWQPGVVVRVQTAEAAQYELLFIREAWGLKPSTAVPPLEFPPDIGTSHMSSHSRSILNRQWDDLWAESWDWTLSSQAWITDLVESRQDPSTPPPSAPPLWTNRYDTNGLDLGAMRLWMFGTMSGEDNYELGVAESVATAWQGGLRCVIEMPFAGDYADRLSATCLVVSGSTRRDPDLYSRALARS